MRENRFIFTAACLAMSFAVTNLYGQTVTLGTWLEEDQSGIHEVTGSGDTFTATVGVIPNLGDGFGERNANRQRVFQLFSEAIDFAAEGDEVQVEFDVTFAGPIKDLDSDFRVTLIDTSTNQGIYPISWDTGTRSGTYSRSRFVDNLDGNGGGADGFDPWGGVLNDAVNGNDNLPAGATGAAPTENNGATALGLVDGNTVTYSIVMIRGAGDSFTFTRIATEQDGDVIYEELTSDPYGMVVGNGPDDDGFASVRGTAINSFDGIAFGIFDDDPFDDYSGDHSYTVSNLSISTPFVPSLGDFDADGDVDGDDVDFYIGNLDQAATGEFAQLDLNDDGNVTLADHDFHVTTLVTTSNGVTGALLGDVDLDGTVDVLSDAFALVAGLNQMVTSRSNGDLNADGIVDVLGDAFLLVSDLGQSTDL